MLILRCDHLGFTFSWFLSDVAFLRSVVCLPFYVSCTLHISLFGSQALISVI